MAADHPELPAALTIHERLLRVLAVDSPLVGPGAE